MSILFSRLKIGVIIPLLTIGLAVNAAPSTDTTTITYLLPVPANAIAFAPLMIAQHKNYYADEGLTVNFVSVRGGADVGKQLAAGNGDLGGALGDTPIILRANGVPIKGVALLGGGALHQLMTHKNRNIQSPQDLKDKTLTVVAYQDTSFFVTMAILGKANLGRTDVDIQAAGPVGIWQLLAAGKADGMVGAPEMGAFAEEEGAELNWESSNNYFPGMAQAILASETMIKNNPETIKKFVRASLKALNEIQQDPDSAAMTYIEAVPAYQGREVLIKKVLNYYSKHVYPGQTTLGQFDNQRVQALQDLYLKNNIIKKSSSIDVLFTNEFVQ